MKTKTKNKADSEIKSILKEIVTESEMGFPITLAYLNDGVYAERPMKMPARRWLTEYLGIVKRRTVKWKSRKSIDPRAVTRSGSGQRTSRGRNSRATATGASG